MTQTYMFPEPGSVPGIPGLFSGCRVDVADDGSFEVSPLAQHPHFEPAPEEEEAVPEEEAPTSDRTEPLPGAPEQAHEHIDMET